MKEAKKYVFHGHNEIPRDVQHLIVDKVEAIEDGLFSSYERLATVELLKGLLTIGANSFGGCTALTIVSIPSTVQEISEDAFSYCQSLTTVHFQNGPKSIGKRAFQSCTSLTTISIPSTVEIIGQSAFRSCTSLESLEMKEGLRMIGSHAFFRCRAVMEISIPSTVWEIGPHAFAKCQSLVDLSLGKGLKSIGQMTFHMCTSLFAVSLPESLESIGNAAFMDCSLMGVEFPLGINVKMESYTFSSCTALVNIYIPPSIEDDEGFAKSGHCTAIKTLKERFVNRPIHEACYYASQSSVDDVIALMSKTTNQDDDLFDGLGMTPFHIVATSSSQRVDLLQVLLDHYPLDAVSEKDRNGRTMMDYLLITRSPKSIPLIQMVLQRTLVDPVVGLDSWRASVQSLVMESSAWQGHLGNRRKTLMRIQNAVELYSLMEMTSLLELAMWKQKMGSKNNYPESIDFKNRQGHRIVSGADVIVPHVLGFLRSYSQSLWS